MTKKVLCVVMLITLFGVSAFATDNSVFNQQSQRLPNAEWVTPTQPQETDEPSRDLIFSQPSDDENTPGWSASNASNAFVIYENFTGVTSACATVRIWGLTLNNTNGWQAVDVDPMQFNVKLWDNVNGLPGTELATITTTVNRTSTGQSVMGFPMY